MGVQTGSGTADLIFLWPCRVWGAEKGAIQQDKTLGPQQDKARITGTDVRDVAEPGQAFPLVRARGSQRPPGLPQRLLARTSSDGERKAHFHRGDRG